MTEPQPEDVEDVEDVEGTEDTFDEDLEAPEADVLEQHTAADRESGIRAPRQRPLEADPADAAEQDLDAGLGDEDDYRDT